MYVLAQPVEQRSELTRLDLRLQVRQISAGLIEELC
jgi:hypothetical protein